jgi:site-specific recombinase XerD
MLLCIALLGTKILTCASGFTIFEVREMLDLENYKNHLRRIGKRESTVYVLTQRLKALPENIDVVDVSSLNAWLDKNFLKTRDNVTSSFCSNYQMIAAIRSYLSFLDREDLRKKIKYPKGKMPRRLKILTDIQVNNLFEVIKKTKDLREKDLFEILAKLFLETGLRRSELLNAKLSWISWDDNRINIPPMFAKGKKERVVFFGDVTKSLMKAYIEKYRLTENDSLCYLAQQTVYVKFKKLMHQANFASSITLHSFRHTFATHLIRKGVNIRTIQILMGHESIISTEIYTHVNIDELKEGAKKAFLD